MSLSKKQFLARYNREVNNMTRRYEKINAAAPTVTRKVTPEENEYYLNLLRQAKKEKEEYDRRRERFYNDGKL